MRDADLILEAVAEDIATKRGLFALLDRAHTTAIVATVSSGLSIAGMCQGRSPAFRAHFLGMHLFNPPTAIVGCELIPHAGTDPDVIATVDAAARAASVARSSSCADTPAFAGNRVGFKVLNEVAQLAEEHGVAFMDQLLGPHTGRALAPLATIDLVGWDVHKAIVDNLHVRTRQRTRRSRCRRTCSAASSAATSAARPATRAGSSAWTRTSASSCSIRRRATTAARRGRAGEPVRRADASATARARPR